MKKEILKHKFFVTIVPLFLFVNIYSQPALKLEKNAYTYVKSNLEFLASDELEGREATTRGAKVASAFIAEELEKYGIEPYGDNGTYFQNFNMIAEGFDENCNISFQFKDNSTLVFENGSDIAVLTSNLPAEKFAEKNYNMIFVGYGIVSEKDNYDSYKDTDVKGKVVVILSGTPKRYGKEILSQSSRIKYRRASSRAKIAAEKGAVGLIVLPNSEVVKYWFFLQNLATSKSFKLQGETKSENNENIPVAFLSENAAKSLLTNEKINFNEINDSLFDPTSFVLKSNVKFSYKILHETRSARNIIGKIEGNDPKLKKEYVAISAHYDHLGTNGNEIYNGADDDGSGTVTILETARELALNKKNKRSVLVIFHTGEEKGLKGSKFLTNNSKYVDSINALINIDMVGRKSEDSIYCIGASKISNEYGKIVEDTNSKTAKFYLDYKFDDPNDPNRFYYRSDHYNYAEKGIPIVFFYDYMMTDYHRPSDTVDKINFTKIVKMVELVENLATRISNLDHKMEVNNSTL